MTYPYRSILNPIAFDDASLLALGLAKEIAVHHGATLHLLHVAPTVGAIGEPDVAEDPTSPGEGKARPMLEEIAAKHLGGLQYKIHTASSTERLYAKAIVQVAKEVEADLIILKTHGRTGLSHLLLGSVAEEVVRTAPCPVMTLTSAARERAAHLKLQPAG
jgi:nucleotide-binding universal stress UspA family protein